MIHPITQPIYLPVVVCRELPNGDLCWPTQHGWSVLTRSADVPAWYRHPPTRLEANASALPMSSRP